MPHNIMKQFVAHIEQLKPTLLSSPKEFSDNLTAFVEFCRSFDHTHWRYIDCEDRLKVFHEVFSFIKEGYVMIQRCRITGTSSESELKVPFSSLFEIQNFFIDALKSNDPCNDLSVPESTAELLLLLLECANKGGILDLRVGVGVWKFSSSLLQQHMNELRRNQVFLEELLSPLLESTRYFYECCLCEFLPNRAFTGHAPNTCGHAANLKMLNLLCRIATFCIKELAVGSVPATMGCPDSNLLAWITWMVSTRYAGGFNPSGSGLPKELVKHLETSMYLSTDVLLAHMTTLAPSGKHKGTECSSAALWLRSANIQPAIRLRIYAGILSNLPRNPHYYSSWVCEEFNMYAEFLTTCAQLDPNAPAGSETNTNSVGDSLTPLVTEFYTTMLKQVCASVCGLPASCYYYLEQALLKGLLINHPWTNLFVADIWCFLARYGPGELCWQYVTMFASVIQQMAVRLCSGFSTQHTVSDAVVLQLDRLGRLLARFLVFLTPKQQGQFFKKYPLNEAALCNLSDPVTGHRAPMIWRFVPLPLSRLQKPAQTVVEEQLQQRLMGLARLIERNTAREKLDVQLVVECALALRLETSLDSSWRESNSSTLTCLTTFLLVSATSFQEKFPSAATVPCAPILLMALQRPVSTFSSLALHWSSQTAGNDIRRLLICNSFLQWLTRACLKVTRSNPKKSPLLSFMTLRTWHATLIGMDESSFQASHSSDWLETLASSVDCVPMDVVSPVCRPVLEHLKQVLPQMSNVHSMDVENYPESEDISGCIQQVQDALTRLESKWNTSECPQSLSNVEAVRKLSQKFDRFLRNLDLTNRL